MDRLDPAWKSLAFLKVACDNAAERVNVVTKFLRDSMSDVNLQVSVENVYKGPKNARVLSEVIVCQFNSRTIRDQVLKKIQSTSTSLPTELGPSVKADYAKSERQQAEMDLF